MKAPLTFLRDDARILDSIRRGDEQGLTMLYASNRKAVTAYVVANSGTPDDAEDMLQEALVVLWERVRSGRFEQTARLDTFVYATVKNMWLRRLSRMRREVAGAVDPEVHADDGPTVLEDLVSSEEAHSVHRALGRIGEPCRTLLLLFYWEELPMEEIARRLGFANADTAKAKKYQCKKALLALVKNELSGET